MADAGFLITVFLVSAMFCAFALWIISQTGPIHVRPPGILVMSGIFGGAVAMAILLHEVHTHTNSHYLEMMDQCLRQDNDVPACEAEWGKRVREAIESAGSAEAEPQD